MKKILWGLLILGALVVSGCGAGGKINGAATGDGTGDGTAAIAGLDLIASKLTLDTNGTDTIDFIVYAKDASNAAVPDTAITIASTGGFLSASSVTTDTTGQAVFTLNVASEKINRQISVTLTAGAASKTQPITISGTTLALTASKLTTTPSDADPVELTATLRDAAAQPIPNATISFTSTLGNTFTPSTGYAFTAASTGTTDSAGLFKVKYTGTNTGEDTIAAISSGVTTTTALTCDPTSLAFFGFTPSSYDPVNVDTTQTLSVAWVAADGSKVGGETLTFYTNKGFWGTVGTTMKTAITNATTGVATVLFNTGDTAGPATITVFDSTTTQTASLELQVRATTPATIDLQVSPGVIPVSTVTATATATLKAIVHDAKNQAVAGKVVNFSILNGPGAGEYISPVTAITDDSGTATSTFTSGGGASAQDGVEIQATVQGVSPDIAKLTIAQNAATISIGTTNKLEAVGSTQYKQPFTIWVTDSNGVAVVGAPVTLGLVPIYFYTGTASTVTGMYVAEDTNRDYFLNYDDLLGRNEDCATELDFMTLSPTGNYWQDGSMNKFATIVNSLAACTGNGRLDPAGVASIDSTVTTGADGSATFYVYYPKSSGNWVDVEITASTDVTGTNSSAKIEVGLSVIEGDIPYLNSPFGY